MTAIDLDAVRQGLAEHRREREGASITTAFNVVTFVEDDPELADIIAERIGQMESRNPLRSLMLAGREGEPRIAMEHVELAVDEMAAPQLQSLVRELLVPAVKTVVLWAGTHVSDPRFSALAEIADVVITFTSRTAESETATLGDMVAMQTTPIGPKLRDLAFLRLGAWQDLVAQFFDDDELTPELDTITQIDVRAGTLSEAYYFIGWLASRLDWQPCGKHEFCNAGGETIRVSIERQGPPRRVASVTLKSANSTFGAKVRADNDDLICLTVEGSKYRDERCLPLNEVDMVSLIDRAIFLPSGNTIYHETLAMVGRLLQHLP